MSLCEKSQTFFFYFSLGDTLTFFSFQVLFSFEFSYQASTGENIYFVLFILTYFLSQ